MKIKKIAFIHLKFPCGGAEKITTYISDELTKAGYRIYLFAEKIDSEKLTDKDQSLILRETPSSVYTRESADFIIEQIRQEQIDLFICPGLVLNYLSRIQQETACKVMYAHHSMPFWEIRAKITAGEHASHKSIGKRIEWLFFRAPKYHIPSYLKNKVYKSYRKRYEEVDIYTVLCEAYAQEICKKTGISREKSKIRVLTNPILDIPESEHTRKKQIVFIGRLTFADKRVDRLLYIWEQLYQKHPDWELSIYGEGDEKDKLMRLAKERALERVHFMGYIKDPSVVYKEASILCMTSSYEGWPLVLTEAQAYGVVPIAFNCCAGIEEIISPENGYGILIKSFDLQAYTKALDKLMNDPVTLQQMQVKVKESVKRFTLDKIMPQWIHLIQHLETKE